MSPQTGSELVAFAGDWHGSSRWVERAIPALRRAGITRLYHVGDFGIWPGDQSFINTVEYWAGLAGLEIWVTPGNHDDYDQIDACIDHAIEVPPKYTPHIRLLPRGFRWEQSGRTFVSLGGAVSVDRAEREEGKTWWARERITQADVDAATTGGEVDILITHEAPLNGTNAVARLRASTPIRDPDADVAAQLVSEASELIQPRVRVHGHWHVADQERGPDGTATYSMAAEFQPGNIGLLNLATLEWSWLSDPRLQPWSGDPMS